MRAIFLFFILSLTQVVQAETAYVNLTIQESKVVYLSRPLKYEVRVKGMRQELTLPCREEGFSLNSDTSLFEKGWSPETMTYFTSLRGEYRHYPFAMCRSGANEAVAWFAAKREFDLNVSDELLDDKYNAKKLPLYIQVRDLSSQARSFFVCDSQPVKKFESETDKSKTFTIAAECRPLAKLETRLLAPIDLVNNPGPLAARFSYYNWPLPSVQADNNSFVKIAKAMLARVPAGKYKGAMSTLKKTCQLETSFKDNVIYLSHQIDSSKRTRRLELKAKNLIGAAEGPMYADLIRVEKESVGDFVAAQFLTDNEKVMTIRFERNTNLEGQVVRINGSESYCRRLQVAP